MKNNKEFRLTTGFTLSEKDFDKSLRKQLKLSTFDIEGTEEEIFYKLNLGLFGTLAMQYSYEDKNINLKDKIEELMQKYSVKRPKSLKLSN